MRNVLTMVAPVLMALALGLVAARRGLVRRFLSADATSPDRAIGAPASNALACFWEGRLRTAGVLQASPSGALWLDRRAWSAFQAARRKRALIVVAVALAALVAVLRLSS
jgi:hypothetical protein